MSGDLSRGNRPHDPEMDAFLLNEEKAAKVNASRSGYRLNPDGTESNVLMAQSDNFAYPTLFQNEKGEFYELPDGPEGGWQARKEAERLGEMYEFGTEEEAKVFAAGGWKEKPGEGEEAAARLSMNAVPPGTDPAHDANVRVLSEMYGGLPLDLVRPNYDHLKRQSEVEGLDLKTMYRRSPAMLAILSSPSAANYKHAQIVALRDAEYTLGSRYGMLLASAYLTAAETVKDIPGVLGAAAISNKYGAAVAAQAIGDAASRVLGDGADLPAGSLRKQLWDIAYGKNYHARRLHANMGKGALQSAYIAATLYESARNMPVIDPIKAMQRLTLAKLTGEDTTAIASLNNAMDKARRESMGQYVKDIASRLGGPLGMDAGVVGKIAMSNVDQAASEFMKFYEDSVAPMTFGEEGFFEKGTSAFAEMVPLMAGAIAAGAIGGEFALAGPAVTAFSSSTLFGPQVRSLSQMTDSEGNYLDKSMVYTISALTSVAGGLAETFALSKTLKIMPGGKKILAKYGTPSMQESVSKALTNRSNTQAIKSFLKNYMVSASTESFEEAFQELSDILGQEFSMYLQGGKWTDDRTAAQHWATIVETFGVTLRAMTTGGALMGGGSLGGDFVRARRIRRNTDIWTVLAGQASSETMNKMDPKLRADALKQIAKKGKSENVFISIEDFDKAIKALLDQEGAAHEAALKILQDPKFYTEAKAKAEESGEADLVIPLEIYLEKVAGTELHDALKGHIRLYQADMSHSQMTTAMAAGQKVLSDALERHTSTYSDTERMVYDDFYSKTVEGTESDFQADEAARIWVGSLANLSEKSGKTLEELHRDYTPKAIRQYKSMQAHPSRFVKVSELDDEKEQALVDKYMGFEEVYLDARAAKPVTEATETAEAEEDPDTSPAPTLKEMYGDDTEASKRDAEAKVEGLKEGDVLFLEGVYYVVTGRNAAGLAELYLDNEAAQMLLDDNIDLKDKKYHRDNGTRLKRVSKDADGNKVFTVDPSSRAINVLLRAERPSELRARLKPSRKRSAPNDLDATLDQAEELAGLGRQERRSGQQRDDLQDDLQATIQSVFHADNDSIAARYHFAKGEFDSEVEDYVKRSSQFASKKEAIDSSPRLQKLQADLRAAKREAAKVVDPETLKAKKTAKETGLTFPENVRESPEGLAHWVSRNGGLRGREAESSAVSNYDQKGRPKILQGDRTKPDPEAGMTLRNLAETIAETEGGNPFFGQIDAAEEWLKDEWTQGLTDPEIKSDRPKSDIGPLDRVIVVMPDTVSDEQFARIAALRDQGLTTLNYDLQEDKLLLQTVDTSSEAFKRFFKQSVVSGESGRPVVVAHGGSFDETMDDVFGPWSHFGTEDAALDRIGGKVVDDLVSSVAAFESEEHEGKWFYWYEGLPDDYTGGEEPIGGWYENEEDAFSAGKQAAQWDGNNVSEVQEESAVITRVYLSIQNPVRLPDMGTWGFHGVAAELKKVAGLTETEMDSVHEAYNRSDGEGWKALASVLRDHGHDGIVYRNAVEDKGSDSYIILSSNQVKSVNNRGTWDPADDRMLYQSSLPYQTEPLALEGGRTRDVGVAFDKAHMDKHGRVLDPQKDRALIVAAMLEEYDDQVENHDSGEGWYKEDIDRAIEATTEIIPELKKPKNRLLFLSLAAAMSHQVLPNQNWAMAVEAFRGYLDSGGEGKVKQFPEKRANGLNWGFRSKNKSIQQLNLLLVERGESGTLDFLFSMHSGRHLVEVREQHGLYVKGSIPKEVTLNEEFLGMRLLGPKITEFALNGTGLDPNAVTVDMWATRFYKRHLGDVSTVSKKAAKAGLLNDDPSKADRATITSMFTEIAAARGVTPSAVQAALWYYEQRLYRSHGQRAESQSFSGAASRVLDKRAAAERAAVNERRLPGTRTQPGRPLGRGVQTLPGHGRAGGLTTLFQSDREMSPRETEAVLTLGRLDDIGLESVDFADEEIAALEVLVEERLGPEEIAELPGMARILNDSERLEKLRQMLGISTAVPADQRLNQSSSPETPEMRAFKEGNALVDENGDLIPLFLGHVANIPDRLRQNETSDQSDLGAAYYMSNSPADVSENYAGLGPDITGRIETAKEGIEQAIDEEEINIEEEAKSRGIALADETIQNDVRINQVDEIAEQMAREKHNVDHGGAVMPVYARMTKPFVLGVNVDFHGEQANPETVLSYEENYDEESDEYGEPEGELIEFAEALRDNLGHGDERLERAISSLFERYGFDGGARAQDLYKWASENWETFAERASDGDLQSAMEPIRQALEDIGYDGIIDHTVNQKFGTGRKFGTPMAGMGGDTVHYAVFNRNQIKSVHNLAPTSDDRLMLQDDPGEMTPRGMIEFGANRRGFDISLFAGRNESTLFHEMGHLYLELLGDLAEAEGAAPGIRQDYITALQFLGVRDRSEIGREQHEKWADSFWHYLTEGKAPSEELKSIFRRIKDWGVSVFERHKERLPALSDEIRGVFDRMIASEADITMARSEAALEPMEFLRGTATESEWQAYIDNNLAAVEQGDDDVRRIALIHERAKRKEEYAKLKAAVTDETEEEFSRSPRMRVLRYLTLGKLPNEEELGSIMLDENGDPWKIGKRFLVEIFGQRHIKKILNSLPKPFVYRIEGGVAPDDIAMLFGYESGQQLVEDLRGSKKYDAMLKDAVEKKMAARYGDIEAEIAGAIPDLVHNEKAATQIHFELRMLRRKMSEGQRGDNLLATRKEFKDRARAWVKTRRAVDTRASTFSRRAEKYGNDAYKLAKAGKLVEAFEAKLKQAFNVELFRAVRDSQKRADSTAKNLTRNQTTRWRSKFGKAGHDYLPKMDALTGLVTAAKDSNRRLARLEVLRGWIETQDSERMDEHGALVLNDAIYLDEALLERLGKVNIREMTFEEIEILRRAMDNIERLAQLENTILAGEERADFEAWKAEAFAVTRASKRMDKKGERSDKAAITLTERAVRSLKELNAWDHKIVEWIRQLDGLDRNGPWARAMWIPLGVAQGLHRKIVNETAKVLIDALDSIPAEARARMLSEKIKIEALDGFEITRLAAIVVALNSGSDSNMLRLQTSTYKDMPAWEENADAAIVEIISNLTDEEVGYVHTIWDAIHTLWPEAEALQQRMTGLAPPKVEAKPWKYERKDGTKFTLKGGYYPVVNDPKNSRVGEMQRAKMEDGRILNTRLSSVSIPASHLKERGVTGGETSILLSLDVTPQHIESVAFDTSHREAVKSIYKILTTTEVADVIKEALGEQAHAAMVKWILRVGGEKEGQTPIDPAIRFIRGNAVFQAMAGKMTVVLQNFANFSNVMEPKRGVKPKYYIPAQLRYLQHERMFFASNKMQEEINAMSTIMRYRFDHWDRDIQDSRYSAMVRKYSGRLRGASKLNDQALEFAYALAIYSDKLIAYPAWQGGYDQHVAENSEDGRSDKEKHDRAVNHADGIVEEMLMASGKKDMSRIQDSGEMMRMFTMFYSWMANAGMRIRALGYDMTNDRDADDFWDNNYQTLIHMPEYMGRLLSFIAGPAILGEVFVGRFMDGDDDETLWQWTLWQIWNYSLGSFFITRKASSLIETEMTGQYRGRGGGLLNNFGTNVAMSSKDLIEQVFYDEEFDVKKTAKAANKLAGAVKKWPSSQINITIGYWYDMFTGKEDPKNILEFIHYSMLYRKRKKQKRRRAS